MRFSTLSLGLAATMFMAVSVYAAPVGDVLDNLGDNKVEGATSDIGNGGVRDTTNDITDKVTDSDLTDCLLDDVLACLSENPKAATALPIKRSVKLSRRELFQPRAETGAVTDAAKSNADTDAAATTNVAPGEEDENEDEEDESELTRRKTDEDEEDEDEDEEDENDKGKRRKRSAIDGEDEEEVDEEEIDEEEVDEEEVEEEEEEADELGDAAPAGRR